jgi:bacterioferritin (cytochrome b1)
LETLMDIKAPARLIEALNRMLAKEHACAIRYATHAVLITGPYVDPVSARLREIASDEIGHAGQLRKRICALGGMPTMNVDGSGLSPALTLGDMLEENIREEREAIEDYEKILADIPPLQVLLYETLEDILKDEQEHLEELMNLVPGREENISRSRLEVPGESRTAVLAGHVGEVSSLDSRD